ncbi:MAG: hypothetical protein LBN37_06420, partial [Bacteroidales bacterium]|nr:hypothetical protein [Bacteroidales bacterium]
MSCKKNDGNKDVGSTCQCGADEQVVTGDGYFLYGSNMGWYGDAWGDDKLAEILIGNPDKKVAGVGVTSLRPAMYDHFVEDWGYDIRKETFAFYHSIGGRDHTIFLNEPADKHRDKTKYDGKNESQIFANLYEPIHTNGDEINKNNYYAWYVYNVVKTYGQYVKFWEVWNEPDFTYNWNASQTWDKVNPNPSDLPNLYAPIQRYVRMLRITYEVVKSLYPDSYVCVGGLGYPYFLDAVLRHSDNPADGSVNNDFPQTGGAWFDCLSYHIYPMYSLSKGNRNSDAAAAAVINLKNEFNDVLKKYGYDGGKHPEKAWIITECNIPRKSIDGNIGSDEAQRNFMIKAAVACQRNDIRALYVYGAADDQQYANATDPYQMMGLYQQITGQPYNVTPNQSGISWRTTSVLLRNHHYDKAASDALALPATVDGAAFSDEDGNLTCVL